MKIVILAILLVVAQCARSMVSLGGIPPGGAIPYPHPGLGIQYGVGRQPFINSLIPPVQIFASAGQKVNFIQRVVEKEKALFQRIPRGNRFLASAPN